MQTWLIIYSSTIAAMVTVLVFFGIKSEIEYHRQKSKKPRKWEVRKVSNKNNDAYLAKIETEAKQISNKLDEIQ